LCKKISNARSFSGRFGILEAGTNYKKITTKKGKRRTAKEPKKKNEKQMYV